MPTTTEEVVAMKDIINNYIPEEHREPLFRELYDRVGHQSDNLSVKLSLLMLNKLYCKDGKILSAKMDELNQVFHSYYNGHLFWWKVALPIVVSVHFAAIFVMIYAFFVLPFTQPLIVWLPLCVLILNLMFTRVDCAMTRFEDFIRRKLGLPQVKLFVSYYLKQLFGK